MNSGIDSIDKVFGDRGFPSSGLVSIVGDNYLTQIILTKTIAKNISNNFDQTIVVSTKEYSWSTKEISRECPTLWILETEQKSVHRAVAELVQSNNRSKYPLLIIDHVESPATLLEMSGIKRLINDKNGMLTIVNCMNRRETAAFNLQSILVANSILSIKAENDKGGTVAIKLFGPYMQKNQ